MADNTTVSPGIGGDVIRDKDIGGVKTQIVQLDVGGASAESLVSTSTPLPVKLYDADGDVASVDKQGRLRTVDESLGSQSADAATPSFIVGDPNGDFAGVNILEQVVTENGDLKVQVNLAGGLLQDANKAIKLSDGILYQGYLSTNAVSIIDCTGYAQLCVYAPSGNINMTVSNDLTNFISLPLGATYAGALATVATAGSFTTFPVMSRYVKLSANSATQYTAILKFGQSSLVNANIMGVNGVSAVTGGLIGILAVGGNIAAGSAPTSNPVPIAWDGVNTRRILTDASSGGVVLGSSTVTNGQSLSAINVVTSTTPAATVVKGSAGRITMLQVSNGAANAAYLHLYNATSVSLGTTASTMVFAISAVAGSNTSITVPDGGLYFSTGICYAFTGAIASTDNTALTAPSLVCNMAYI